MLDKLGKTHVELLLEVGLLTFTLPFLLREKLTQNSSFFSFSLPTHLEERKKESSSIFASISCQILKSNRLIHKFLHKTSLLRVIEGIGGFGLKGKALIYLVPCVCKVSAWELVSLWFVRWNWLVIGIKDAILWVISRLMVELCQFFYLLGNFLFYMISHG